VPEIVVLGGGHNGLVAAAYLARAGRDVLVLERRDHLGGAAVSERPFPGHPARLSRYAYLVSLLPRRIARDLGVQIELRDRAVAACAPVVRHGRPAALLLDEPATSERTRASFAAVCGGQRDHEALLRWGATCGAVARRLFPTLTGPLPSRAQAERLLADVPGAWQALVEHPLGEALRARFADPLVRGMVATDGLIGTFAALDDPSLVQNRCFLYHVIGGGDGRWRVPVGGMGAVSGALEGAARAAGAALRTGAEVLRVDHAAGDSEVTWREDGREHAVRARWVLADVAPATLAALEGRAGGDGADAAPEGSQLKVNLLLDRLPRLRSGVAPEDAFAGTLRLHESADELAAAHAQAAAGALPEHPPAELYCHTLTDRSILGPDAPPEQHTLTVFGLHAPARLFAADEDGARRDALAERTLDALDAHLAEPIRPLLARDREGRPCLEAKSPRDLECELGLPGGHIFHGDLAWPWAEDGEAAGGWGVATGHPRTLVCGSGAVRGGGVSGIGGHNAAMHVLAGERSVRARAA
jgi:phytoene dehydrogenase-like protein